ncbi:protein of unknown function [Azospirillum lipoferum 4B]|uniref:Uncharacterized protein n=1 Tax=Azospirillum lipoferum (strain 4B) TaxID=862719 RepID=G7Z5P9_AZOL4|nr:protein of unknown function [Azospirillum lipoferum 4B]
MRKNSSLWQRIALLPLREKGWDEGCCQPQGRCDPDLRPPSPQPLSRKGRGAFLNAKLHVFSQARDLCMP